MNHPKLNELASLLDGALPEAAQLRKLAETAARDAATATENQVIGYPAPTLNKLSAALLRLLDERETIQRAAAVVITELDEEFGKLLEAIVRADAILKEHIGQCVNGGPSSCYICGESDKWRDQYEMTIRAALAACDQQRTNERDRRDA